VTNDGVSEGKRSRKPRRVRAEKPEALVEERTIIKVEHSGDWMPVEDLWQKAKEAVETGRDVTINLEKIDHLDASALQILLALHREQKRLGRGLEVCNASPVLRQWFDYAGAARQFFPAEASQH